MVYVLRVPGVTTVGACEMVTFGRAAAVAHEAPPAVAAATAFTTSLPVVERPTPAMDSVPACPPYSG